MADLGSTKVFGDLTVAGDIRIGGASGNITAPDFIQSSTQSTNAAACTRKDYVDSAIAAGDALQVSKTGDTMTGNLTAPAVLVSSAQNTSVNALTRKDYVDTAIAAGDALQVSKTGDTMTGNLTAPKVLVSDAQGTESNALTRKDYVDSAIAAGDALQVSKTGDTMTGNLTAPAVLVSSAQNTSVNALTRKDYVDSAIAAGDALQVSKTGDTMTGNLTVPAVNLSGSQSSAPNTLTRKDYVDGEIAKQVAKTGGTMTGTLTVPKSRGLATAAGADGSYACISGEDTYTMMWRMNGSTTKADEFIGIDSASRLIFRKDRGLGDKTWDDYSVYHQGFKPTAADVGALSAGGTAVAATKLATARTIAGVAFDGTTNITLTAANVGALQAGGTAVAATKLATARTINGTNFDGTANITTANWGTARTLTIGNSGKSVNGGADVSWSLDEIGAARAKGELSSGATENITTDQFVQWLKDSGAFNERVWIARGSWSYANNKTITDTGCGNIHLAGCTIEVISGSEFAFTIRIITPTTTSGGGTTGAEFVYVNNGSAYSPGWRRIYTTAWKPNADDVGALPSGGTAVAATKLATARTIGGVSFDGTANINLPGVNIAGNQSTTGNAATATKLATARTISGVAFDGTANITLTAANVGALQAGGTAVAAAKLATARTISGVSFDGTANITLTAADVGALQAGDTAVAATKLATARTIGGVSFDGTANINLPGVNTAGNQSTTGNAATATKLATARTIAGVAFDGTANISLTAADVGALPVQAAGGVLEVGKYIDFHDAGTNVDYSLRLMQEGTSLRVQGANGYVDVGAKNTDYAHYYTDRPQHFFDKDVNVNDLYVRSDVRLKSNLEPLSDALAKVCSLKGWTYDKKLALDSEAVYRRETGLIAQDVQKVLPSAVHAVEGDLLTLSSSALVALLVEAVKELSAKVEALENVGT